MDRAATSQAGTPKGATESGGRYPRPVAGGRCVQTVSQLHGIKVDVLPQPACRELGRWAWPKQPEMFDVEADASGFVYFAKHWMFERAYTWNELPRRLVMHHGRLLDDSQASTWPAEARLLARRRTS